MLLYSIYCDVIVSSCFTDSGPRQGLSQSYFSPGHSPTASLPTTSTSLANSGNFDYSPTQSVRVHTHTKAHLVYVTLFLFFLFMFVH